MLQSSQQQQREKKVKYWQPHIEQWKKSQLSASEYCRKNNLNIHQFKYYQYQLMPDSRNRTSSQGMVALPFSEINVVPVSSIQALPSSKPIEIILTSGQRLQIPDNFHEPTVKRLLHLLGVQ